MLWGVADLFVLGKIENSSVEAGDPPLQIRQIFHYHLFDFVILNEP